MVGIGGIPGLVPLITEPERAQLTALVLGLVICATVIALTERFRQAGAARRIYTESPKQPIGGGEDTTLTHEAAEQLATKVDWSVGGTIRKHAAARPEAPFLTYGDRTITYAEMHERSNRVAQGLIAEDVGSQEHVAFLDKNSPEYFEVLFGGGKANVVDVAINWRLAAPEIEFVINDSQAKVLFVGEEFFPHLDQIEERLTAVKKIVAIGNHPRHESYEAWVARHPVEDPGAPSAADDIAMQLYTSGTTGRPKGAMITNANLGTLIGFVAPPWGFDATSVNLVAMPLFHIGGSGWALVGMNLGCHSILLREPVPQLILDVMEQHRITNAFIVPALLNFLSQVPGAAERDFSSLRTIVYGASPITEEVLRRSMATFKCKFIQVYGLTETTGAITELSFADHDLEGPHTDRLRSAGKPYPWVEIRIVEPDTKQDLPTGKVGELWVRTIQNMKGYWNQPDDTAASFADGEWFKTGDAGYYDEDGYIYLTDRVKDMIDSGGENIYPIEVENVVADHPDVADVGVIGVPDEKWGETVKAIVVKREGANPTAEDIIAFAKERLAGFKCPTSVDFIEALPRTPSGKILKRELREPYWKGHERRIH